MKYLIKIQTVDLVVTTRTLYIESESLDSVLIKFSSLYKDKKLKCFVVMEYDIVNIDNIPFDDIEQLSNVSSTFTIVFNYSDTNYDFVTYVDKFLSSQL